MVLPKIIGCPFPIIAVFHKVACRLIVAVGVLYEEAVIIGYKILVQAVIPAQTYVVHILVLFYSGVPVPTHIAAVHEAEIIVAGSNAVPGLSGFFKVADIAIAHHNTVTGHPHKAAVVAAGLTPGPVYESIGLSAVESAVYDKAVLYGAC